MTKLRQFLSRTRGISAADVATPDAHRAIFEQQVRPRRTNARRADVHRVYARRAFQLAAPGIEAIVCQQ
jgi:hypothetical protein